MFYYNIYHGFIWNRFRMNTHCYYSVSVRVIYNPTGCYLTSKILICMKPQGNACNKPSNWPLTVNRVYICMYMGLSVTYRVSNVTDHAISIWVTFSNWTSLINILHISFMHHVNISFLTCIKLQFFFFVFFHHFVRFQINLFLWVLVVYGL